MANKWTTALRKMEGAVTEQYDPYAHGIRTPSPSVNMTFGKTHCLPLGYSVLLWGKPKAGKTLLSNATIGQLHRDDPEAIVVKFDTEFRDSGQLTEETAATFGIDLDRYVVFQVNEPAQVFDRFQQEIGALVQAGAPIKLVIIDSITGIQGRREADSESIDKQQIGDHALTVQIGLKRILPIQRRHKIGLIITAHARAEMDMWEIKRGHKTKAAASFGVLHHCEYFLNVERNLTASGRQDALGNEFLDESRKDSVGDADATGHRIKVWMQESSVGPQGRTGEFTIDYAHGIINVHEEVFNLGIGFGIIQRPNAKTYVIGTETFNGKPATLTALEKSPELQKFVINALKESDLNNKIRSVAVSEPEAE